MALKDRFDELIARFAPEIRRAFQEAVRDINDNTILRQVVEAIERRDIDGAFRALGYSQPALNPIFVSIAQAFEAGGIMVMAQFPKYVADATDTKQMLRFDVRDPRAEKWLREESSSLIVNIEQDIRQNVRETLEEGFAEGRNPRNLALDLVGRYNRQTKRREGGVVGLGTREAGWARSARQRLRTLDPRYLEMSLRDKRFDGIVRRAIESGDPLPAATVEKLVNRYRDNALRHRGENIGRTEALQALNKSEWLSIKQSIETGDLSENAVTRVWDSAGDMRVRPSHAAMDEQKVKGLDEPFVSPLTGARMLHPGDTSLGAPGREVIACRCRVRVEVDWFYGVE